MCVDLHRHDEFSPFDGFGKAMVNAKHAVELGYDALGLTNHGNTNGLVQHHLACKAQGIKPILGVEAYFQPTINTDKPRYHLCLFAKDLGGYTNINRLQRIGTEQMYYKPIITFKDLEEHSEGLIVSSACIAGLISQSIVKGNNELAYKVAKRFKGIFGDDFYIEVQPYKISEKGLQEKVNIELIRLAQKLGIKCILTSDSHYTSKDDWGSYLKMHEMRDSKKMDDLEQTYEERYMPEPKELGRRFVQMHDGDFDDAHHMAKQMYKNMKGIVNKVEDDILGQLPLNLPVFVEGVSSYKKLVNDVKVGLKARGKLNDKYIERCKEELDVIKGHGFADYFLIVADYVKWAKSQGIAVGPGRGSVCNSVVAYALSITEVDSIYHGLDFRRFLRHDKSAIPDIDLDFETDRRGEVIDYIVNKYHGHAAQIKSYGLYKPDVLVNDLAKVCGVEDKLTIDALKTLVKKYIEDSVLNVEGLMGDKQYKMYNSEFDDILKHFIKMYKKLKYVGTHAAGVAITGGNIENYTALLPDKKTGKTFTAYDLSDLKDINVIKFDILGLNTMSQIIELRNLTGDVIEDSWFEDEKLYEKFREGKTNGIFQFEKGTAQRILSDIQCDCFEDVIAASSMNRPGPLSLGMPEIYANNKENGVENSNALYLKYTKETYGTIIYQEQVQQICINIGGMDWKEADVVMKMLKGGNMTDYAFKIVEENKKVMKEKFVKGAKTKGMSKADAEDLFEKMLVYSFNKGHGTGYSIISLEQMYYKVYFPLEFWYVKMKYAPNEADLAKFKTEASQEGIVLMLPHVNYSADFCIKEFDGEETICEGLSSIKNVGEKAALVIEDERKANGPFKSYDDFIERVPKRNVNARVVEALLASGALEFNKKTYISRVTKYNSTLFLKGMRSNGSSRKSGRVS